MKQAKVLDLRGFLPFSLILPLRVLAQISAFLDHLRNEFHNLYRQKLISERGPSKYEKYFLENKQIFVNKGNKKIVLPLKCACLLHDTCNTKFGLVFDQIRVAAFLESPI